MTKRSGFGSTAALVVWGLLLTFAGIANSSPALLQPRPQANDRLRRTGEPAGPRVPEIRDETFRLMDAYVISNIQEGLGLSDEQFARALPLVKRLHSNRREFARKRMQALRLLRRALTTGSATEAGVGDLLKDLKTATAEEREATLRDLEALDSILTPLQQAKYRVFEAEVEARLRNLLIRSQERDRPPVRF